MPQQQDDFTETATMVSAVVSGIGLILIVAALLLVNIK